MLAWGIAINVSLIGVAALVMLLARVLRFCASARSGASQRSLQGDDDDDDERSVMLRGDESGDGDGDKAESAFERPVFRLSTRGGERFTKGRAKWNEEADDESLCGGGATTVAMMATRTAVGTAARTALSRCGGHIDLDSEEGSVVDSHGESHSVVTASSFRM